MALNHVWYDLAVGHFQSGGGQRLQLQLELQASSWYCFWTTSINTSNQSCQHYVSFDAGLLLLMRMVALHAEFDQYLDALIIIIIIFFIRS